MKKVYKVVAEVTSYCYIYVRAKDGEEAIEKAKEIDGGDFIPDDRWDSGSFEIDSASLINKPSKEILSKIHSI